MANKIIGEGVYNQPTRFKTPWPFYIVDNFLSDQLYTKLIMSRQHPKFEVVDSWHDNAIRTSSDTIPGSPTKRALPLYQDKSVTEQISAEIKNKLADIVDDSLYCLPDLIRCDPGYRYTIHTDYYQKLYSIVVYLHPTMSNATTLLDVTNNEYDVMWRQNRALIFAQEDHGLHYYKNTTQYPRLTLNVYMTKEYQGFGIVYINSSIQ
jgi:hypothetical protein